MDEGWKILLGAGAGFAAGLLGETVKFPLTQRLKRRQVERALYKDLALIRISLKFSQRQYDHNHRLEETRLAPFDHYFNTERTAFYQIPGSHILEHIFELIRAYTKEQDAEEAQHLLGTVLMAIDLNIQSGTLSGKLLDSFERSFVNYTIRHSNELHSPGPWWRRLYRRLRPESAEDVLREP